VRENHANQSGSGFPALILNNLAARLADELNTGFWAKRHFLDNFYL
jgi:hypothetical protein